MIRQVVVALAMTALTATVLGALRVEIFLDEPVTFPVTLGEILHGDLRARLWVERMQFDPNFLVFRVNQCDTAVLFMVRNGILSIDSRWPRALVTFDIGGRRGGVAGDFPPTWAGRRATLDIVPADVKGPVYGMLGSSQWSYFERRERTPDPCFPCCR